MTWESYRATVRQRRAALIVILGGQCVGCGSNEELEFHHRGTRTWIAAKVSQWRRTILYREEAEGGEIELRCGTCNKRAGKPQRSKSPAAKRRTKVGR